MAVELIGSGQVTWEVATSAYVLTVPGTVRTGDVLVIQVTSRDGHAISTLPAGASTLISPQRYQDQSVSYSVHVWEAPATVPGSITINLTSSLAGGLQWLHLRGAEAEASGSAGILDWPLATSFSAPSTSTAHDGAFVVGGVNMPSGSRVVTAPSGWTLAAQSTERIGAIGHKGVQANAGSTGASGNWTISGATLRGSAWQLGIRPGPDVPPPTYAEPTAIASTAAVGAAAAVLGAVLLGPTGIAPAHAVGTPAVSIDTGTIHPVGIAPTAAVGTPTAAGSITLGPVGIAPARQVGAPSAWVLPPSGPVPATDETQQFPAGSGDIADDPAIWVNPDDPALSVIIGTSKDNSNGGLAVYSLDGSRRQFLQHGKMNNVDLRPDVFDGRILVAASDRTNNRLAFYWLDPSTRTLSTAGTTALSWEPYGLCLYVSPTSGKVFSFVTQDASPCNIDQHELSFDPDTETVSGTKVRGLQTSTLTEGIAGDDQAGYLFLAEEDVGLYRYNAEPDGGSSRTTIDTVVGGTGTLKADVEGVGIAHGRHGDPGYLVVSSQGDSTYQVYDLAPPHAHRKSFTVVASGGVDGAQDTDGLDITRADLSPLYPHGLLVVHDAVNTGGSMSNYKLVDAGPILGTYATSWPITTAPEPIPASHTLGTPAAATSLTASPDGIPPSSMLGQPTAATTVTAEPGGIAPTAQVGTPTATGALTAAPAGIPPAHDVGAPTVVLGANLAPAGIPPQHALGTPSAATTLTATPTGVAPTAQVGTPEVTQPTPSAVVRPQGIAATATVGEPATVYGALTARPAGIASTAAVGTPRIAGQDESTTPPQRILTIPHQNRVLEVR